MNDALTIISAISIISLATIAFLNVVYLRLHDVQKKDPDVPACKEGAEGNGQTNRPAYVYVYDSPRAHTARKDLRKLPIIIGAMTYVFVVFIFIVEMMHIGADSTNERGAFTIPGSFLAWTVLSYVLALLAVVPVVCARVYRAMTEVNVE